MIQLDDNNITNNKQLIFYIRVQYRRNSSWQGRILWVDGKSESIFRSVLELGNLIQDARDKALEQVDKKIMSGY